MLPYARGITFSSEVIDLGNPFRAVLAHPNSKLLAGIADFVIDGLRRVGGDSDFVSDRTPRIADIRRELQPEARTVGLALVELARLARAGFSGAEAIRAQRGRDAARVRVRISADGRDCTSGIEGHPPHRAREAEVPVVSVAPLNSGVLLPAAPPKDGQRGVKTIADMVPCVISRDDTSNVPANSALAVLTAGCPNLTYAIGDEQQQKRKSVNALCHGFAIVRTRHNSVSLLMSFTPLVRERAIQDRFPLQTSTSLGCSILFVTANFMIVYFAHSNARLCLIASDGSSGVRPASCIQMQGGHG